MLSLNTSVSTRRLQGNLLEYVTTVVLEDLSCHCQPYTQRNSYSLFLNIFVLLCLWIASVRYIQVTVAKEYKFNKTDKQIFTKYYKTLIRIINFL